jgi:hypothetical protein
MRVKIDDLVFGCAKYDADGDVLYLGRGSSNSAADTAQTPRVTASATAPTAR